MATVVGFQQYFAGLRWFTRGFTIVDWISTVFRWSSIGLFLNLPCRSGFGSVAGGALTAESGPNTRRLGPRWTASQEASFGIDASRRALISLSLQASP